MLNTLNVEIVMQYTAEYFSTFQPNFVNDLGDVKSKAHFSFLLPSNTSNIFV